MQLGCSWGLLPAHTHLPASPFKLWTERHAGPVVQELAQTTVPSPLWVSALLAGPLLLPGRATTWVVCGWEPGLAHRPARQLLSALGQAFRGGHSGPGRPLLHGLHTPVRPRGLEQAAHEGVALGLDVGGGRAASLAPCSWRLCRPTGMPAPPPPGQRLT